MTYTLSAAVRTVKGEKVRAEGKLPAVIYGAGQDPQSLSLNESEFVKLYRQAGDATLIDLVLDGKDAGKVLVQDVQYDPVSDQAIHVDFRRIDMNKPMTAPVALRFVGEAPVVKAQGGTLVTNLSTVEVRCLPKDLVSHIDVDLSVLTSFDEVIQVKSIKVPAGVEITAPNADDLVAKAAPAMSEEEIKAMEESSSAQADLSKIAVVSEEKKKKEEEAAEAEKASK